MKSRKKVCTVLLLLLLTSLLIVSPGRPQQNIPRIGHITIELVSPGKTASSKGKGFTSPLVDTRSKL